ncbi:MAG: hypothetical protein FJ381_07725 [Verrucomicrobia bacterium]|nr:hypothetical protein [Verrucomicrobiota bacterium]
MQGKAGDALRATGKFGDRRIRGGRPVSAGGRGGGSALEPSLHRCPAAAGLLFLFNSRPARGARTAARSPRGGYPGRGRSSTRRTGPA